MSSSICRALPLLLLFAGCGATPRPPTPSERGAAATATLEALRAGRFEDAVALAGPVLARDRGNSAAAAARAVGRYQDVMHQLLLDMTTVLEGAERHGGLNHAYMRSGLERALAGLTDVDADLAVVAGDAAFALELCLACWERDWNRNGRVDEGDEKLLQIETDATGAELPDGDPRRTPQFRFDVGDAHWARAMVAFQRSVLELLLAYRYTDLDRLFGRGGGDDKLRIVLHLGDSARVGRARELVLAGLDAADRAREAYLAETDDDREWVPSPRQKNHPMPLPADENLYRTWADVAGDLRRLVKGEEGLSVAELAQLGDHQWDQPPGGFINFGHMFAAPGDIVVDLGKLWSLDLDRAAAVEETLRDVLGAGYVTRMKASPLVGRLKRMKGELDRGDESLERKLRYFLWLN